MPVTVGDEIAPLIGAQPGEVVMIPNVTMAQASVLSSLPYTAPRNRVVMTALDFPSVRYVYDGLATRLGAEIVVVPGSADGLAVDTQQLIDAIDERTQLVCISHVLFKSAYIMDVAAICRRAHDVGALVSLDSFHAVGILPVDVRAIGCDFLTGGVLKWLCGGPGGCFLYVSPDVRNRLEPALTGWQAHARPFGFEPEMDLATNAFRWLGGTPVIPALYAAAEGPRIVRRAGVRAIREKSIRQTTQLIQLADARGYVVHAPRDAAQRGGTVALDVPHAYEVSQFLLELAMDAIDEALSTDAWREFEHRRAVVT